MNNLTTISLATLGSVSGGASWGNTLRAGAVAGMGLATGEQAPSFPILTPGGQAQSAVGAGGGWKAFQPLALPGGGTATFGR